jgi:YidC/Oxa1 family membrane protein insertase
MDKKTIAGFVLLALFMAGFIHFNNSARVGEPPAITDSEPVVREENLSQPPVDTLTPARVESSPAAEAAVQEIITAQTNLFIIEFSPYGGSIKSLKLKDFDDEGHQLEMVLTGDEPEAGAFLLYFDKDNMGRPFYGPFTYTDRGNGIYEFRAEIAASVNGEQVPFILTKTYEFKDNEYLFRLDINLTQPDGKYLPLNFDGYSYTLESAPQTGPSFIKLDNKTMTYRHNIYLEDGKRKQVNLRGGRAEMNERLGWIGISEKYFVFLGVPNASPYRQLWTDKPVEGLSQGNQFAFSRREIRSSSQNDSFYFYVGPKLEEWLQRYNKSNENAFGVSGFNLGKAMDEARVLWIVEQILKAMLTLSYKLVGNWGFSILIVTLIVKILLFPLSLKGMISTARMGELQPKLLELQARYKNDPKTLQREQMKLYQKEGINPMSGCLPLLIQMPILFAMYGLFNKYFEFRDAPFVGWITDLSAPDLIATLPFSIPFFIGNAVRLLPVIYVVTQLIMNKVTQATTPAQNEQMKLIMNLMPIIFFFVLYDMPSGLLLYWIFSNILSLVQQLIINKLKKDGVLTIKKSKSGTAGLEKKIVPKGRR